MLKKKNSENTCKVLQKTVRNVQDGVDSFIF